MSSTVKVHLRYHEGLTGVLCEPFIGGENVTLKLEKVSCVACAKMCVYNCHIEYADLGAAVGRSVYLWGAKNIDVALRYAETRGWLGTEEDHRRLILLADPHATFEEPVKKPEPPKESSTQFQTLH